MPAMGITQRDSAAIQGCSERTVRNHLTEARQLLDPTPNLYDVCVSALRQELSPMWRAVFDLRLPIKARSTSKPSVSRLATAG
jgi:hypothetical protein